MMLVEMLGMARVEGMVSAVGMLRLTALGVMAVMMVAMLAVRVLVAVMAFAVMDVFGGRGIGLCWGGRAGRFV